MLVNVIPINSVDSFDYFLFPTQNPLHDSYFQQQVETFSNKLTDIGRSFMEGTRKIYETANDSRAINLAKAALKYARGALHPNMVVPLKTLADLQCAQPIMQRYMMANPMVQQYYFDNRIEGYSDSYVPLDHGKIGESNYDYRRVMNGIITNVEEPDGSLTWVAPQYYEELREGDRELDMQEQSTILKSWDILELFLHAGKEDPTSIYGAKIRGM